MKPRVDVKYSDVDMQWYVQILCPMRRKHALRSGLMDAASAMRERDRWCDQLGLDAGESDALEE